MMAKLFRIKIFCAKCNAHIYDYDKDKRGHLIKCYKDMIVKDSTCGKPVCQKCGQVFTRETMIHGRPANKIIQGAVYHKGSC